MAISRTQQVSANAATATITAAQAGDLILVFAYSTTTTVPSLPSGYTNLQGGAGTQQAYRCGYKLAAGGETNCGTWTNATNVACHVYRGVDQTTPVSAPAAATAGNSATLSYAGLTYSANSFVVGFGANKAATAGMGGFMSGGPPVLSVRTNQTTINGCDVGPQASGGTGTASTLSVTGSGRWFAITVEVEPAPLAAIIGNASITFGALSLSATGGEPGPGIVAGLEAWWKADAQSLSDGASVTTWPDSSGKGHTLNHQGSTPPVWKASILNGKPVWRWSVSGSDNRLMCNETGLPAPWTVFLVAKQTDKSVTMDVGSGEISGGWAIQFTTNGYLLINGAYGDSIDHSGAFHYLSVIQGSSLSSWIDGVLTGIGGFGGSGSAVVSLGRNGGLGDIAEAILYAGALSDSDRQMIESYFVTKYAIYPTRTANTSVTFDALTVTSGATHPVIGTAAVTLGALVLSADADAASTGTLVRTFGALSLSAAGVVINVSTGNLSVTLGSLAIATDVDAALIANLTATFGALTVSAASTNPRIGTASITFGTLTVSATATEPVIATASITLGSMGLSASGTTGFAGITGTANIALGALGLSATANAISTATASINLGSLALSASATHPSAGTSAITLGTLTISATGAGTITASAVISLGAMTLSGTGVLAVKGAGSLTLGSIMLTASAGAPANTANLNVTFGAMAISATGMLGRSANASITLGALTVSSAAIVPLTGNSTITFGALSLAAAAKAPAQGNSTVTFGALSFVSTTTVKVTGDAPIDLDALTVAAAGSNPLQATAAIAFGLLDLDASAIATFGASATANILFGPLTITYPQHPIIVGDVTGGCLTITKTSGVLCVTRSGGCLTIIQSGGCLTVNTSGGCLTVTKTQLRRAA